MNLKTEALFHNPLKAERLILETQQEQPIYYRTFCIEIESLFFFFFAMLTVFFILLSFVMPYCAGPI